MEVLAKLVSVSPAREIQGSRETFKVVDVVLQTGSGKMVASAFDKVADQLINGTITPSQLLFVSLRFSVSTNSDRVFNSIRINEITSIFDLSPDEQ